MIKSETQSSQIGSSNGNYQRCLSDHHSQSSLPSQAAAAALNQASIYPHSGFKFSHSLASNSHQFGDVAPSALVMPGNHSPTAVQLTAATATAVDYSTLGSLNSFAASHASSAL